MTDDRMPDELLFPREYHADAAYADRASSAFFRFTAWRPGRVLGPLIVIAVFSVGAYVLNTPWYILTFGGLIGWAIGLVVNFRRMRQRLRATVGDGGMYSIGFRQDAVVLATPRSRAENDYRAFEEMIVRGDFVFLRLRASRIYSLLPGELFTPESMQWMRERMAA